MQTANIKASAHELIDRLPETVSWSELAYHIEVRASIERGLEDVKAGRTYTTDEVKKHLGLTE
jgi:predicted transcriptional regulator